AAISYHPSTAHSRMASVTGRPALARTTSVRRSAAPRLGSASSQRASRLGGRPCPNVPSGKRLVAQAPTVTAGAALGALDAGASSAGSLGDSTDGSDGGERGGGASTG